MKLLSKEKFCLASKAVLSAAIWLFAAHHAQADFFDGNDLLKWAEDYEECKKNLSLRTPALWVTEYSWAIALELLTQISKRILQFLEK